MVVTVVEREAEVRRSNNSFESTFFLFLLIRNPFSPNNQGRQPEEKEEEGGKKRRGNLSSNPFLPSPLCLRVWNGSSTLVAVRQELPFLFSRLEVLKCCSSVQLV